MCQNEKKIEQKKCSPIIILYFLDQTNLLCPIFFSDWIWQIVQKWVKSLIKRLGVIFFPDRCLQPFFSLKILLIIGLLPTHPQWKIQSKAQVLTFFLAKKVSCETRKGAPVAPRGPCHGTTHLPRAQPKKSNLVWTSRSLFGTSANFYVLMKTAPEAFLAQNAPFGGSGGLDIKTGNCYNNQLNWIISCEKTLRCL